MINIKATNIDLTEELRDYIEKRVTNVLRFAPNNSSDHSYIDIGKTTNHHKQGDIYKAEFNIVSAGTKFHSLSEKDEIHAAIDDAHDELARLLKESKDTKISLLRRGARSIKKMLKGLSKRNPMTSKVEEE